MGKQMTIAIIRAVLVIGALVGYYLTESPWFFVVILFIGITKLFDREAS